MNWLLAAPLELRLAAIFAFGLLLGGQWNRGIYRLAWNPRAIGPWSQPLPQAPTRRWYDRLPVLGWFALRRESALHGRWYWLRPALIELASGLGLAALYYYEVAQGGLVPAANFRPDPAALHAQYFCHVVLISLMMVATFIDFDEQTIPDEITVPGTVVGLSLAAFLPMSRPWVIVPTSVPDWGWMVNHLHVTTPLAWPAWLDRGWGLTCGLAAFAGWWLAILPWTWTVRRGWFRAVRYAVASLRRRTTGTHVAIAVLGLPAIAGVWLLGGERWESLLSALVGVAFGGALVWGVRIVGTFALRQEAMGFGDVTLMAMIGAFTGWQATLLIFFLAPFAAVLISITQWLLTRRKDIAFGPYLCLATLFLLVRWPQLWDRGAQPLFELGWFIPIAVLVCLALMGAMLTIIRNVREWLTSEKEPDGTPQEPPPVASPEAPVEREAGF